MKNESIAFIMAMVCDLSGFAILEMLSNGIVRQGMLAFVLLISMAIVSFIGGFYFSIKN